MARITMGNIAVAGFVKFSKPGQFTLGTGSYTNSNNEKVYKQDVTVFMHEKYDGIIPADGDYVVASADLSVSPRKDKPEELTAAMNVRFSNQVTQSEAPKKAAAAGGDDDDI